MIYLFVCKRPSNEGHWFSAPTMVQIFFLNELYSYVVVTFECAAILVAYISFHVTKVVFE